MIRDHVQITLVIEGPNRAGEAVVRATGTYVCGETGDVSTFSVVSFEADPRRVWVRLRDLLRRRARRPLTDVTPGSMLEEYRASAGLATVGEEESTQ